MKLLACLIISLALATTLQGQTPAATPNVDEAQVKQELDEAARAYREGNFVDAQAHSERALRLDPQNKKAPMFVARTIHAQYKPGDNTLGNVAKAREAIVAYQRILERSPDDEESYKAVAYLYMEIKEDELFREWVMQRAGNVSLPNEKRAVAFVVLAVRDWDCSFKITELPTNKVMTVDGNEEHFSYHMPKERDEFERAKECANHGLEMANTAISLTPENESAWSYKTSIIRELEKFAEMSGQVQRKRELHQQYEEALKQTTKLSQRSKSNP